MKIVYNHGLKAEEAYNRIDNLLKNMAEKYADKISNPETRWNSDHSEMDFGVKVMGFGTNGKVYLEDGKITLEGKLPFAARIFKGKIENMVKEQLEELFS